VTIVSGFDVPQSTLESFASSLKSSLATGGTVDGDAIELQGDHRDRLPALLVDHGTTPPEWPPLASLDGTRR